MKARKLIKDTFTNKQNIVFLGSYGFEPSTDTYKMLLSKQGNLDTLISKDLLISNTELIQYNYFYLNLYFQKQKEKKFIEITSNYSESFKWLLQFTILDKNESKTIRESGTGTKNHKISIDELIDKYKQYNIISNFMIAIICESESSISDEFVITYPTKKSKLAYNKDKYTTTNPYTYIESQEFNYSTGAKGVKDALIPRLSVIKGELWYKSSYGLPLMDKIKSKGIYDSIIVRYITDYTDVTNLEEFSSNLNEHVYTFDCKINTIYGEKINLTNE